MPQPSHDSEVHPQVQLPPQLLDLWETEIVPQLPEKLEEQARVLKAYQRHREIERAICYVPSWPGCWEDVRSANWVVGQCCWESRISRKQPGGNACDCAEIGCSGC